MKNSFAEQSIEFLKTIQKEKLKKNSDKTMELKSSFFVEGKSLTTLSEFTEAQCWKAIMQSGFKGVDDWFKINFEQYFSPFDDYADKCRIWFASQAVSKVLPLYNCAVPEVVFGTFPMPYVNAHCIKSPYGGYIVALNKGTFSFIENMAVVFGLCFSRKNHTDNKWQNGYTYPDKETIKSKTFANKLFVDTLRAYLLNEVPTKISLIDLENDVLPWVRDLAGPAYVFLLAHEYAHIIFNHKPKPGEEDQSFTEENSSLRQRILPTGEIKYEVVPNAWLREYEADSLAIKISFTYLLQTMDKYNAFFGIEFFLSIIRLCDIIERREDLADYYEHNLICGKSYWGKSHSIAWDRLNHIRLLIKELMPNDYNKMIAESAHFYKPWEYLFEINDNEIQKLISDLSEHRR